MLKIQMYDISLLAFKIQIMIKFIKIKKIRKLFIGS